MINNNTILTEVNGSTATIWLNRPEKRNALDIEMISGFLKTMQNLNNSPEVRIIIIRGKGESFCAGADLNWMQRSQFLSGIDNYSECEALAKCFLEVFNSPGITISLVHGSSLGGGNGFVAASDISLAESSAKFAFSEVQLGLVPAIIAPYIFRRTGRAKAMELMLTGRKFTAEEARDWGLVSEVLPADDSKYLSGLVKDLLKGAPMAQRIIKTRLNIAESFENNNSAIEQTAALLAETRIGDEAKEGIKAFLEKRKPIWNNE